MKALILVDLQNDFLPGGALAVPHGDEVIPVANLLQAHFPVVVATQDWHPPNHLSFAANHKGKKPGDVIELAGLQQVLWPIHCVQGSRGAELSAKLDRTRIEKIFHKATDPEIDSYSAFFDNGHRKSTGLANYLKEKGGTEVTILGLATDYCVRYSALDARQLGFKTFVIKDGCRGIDLVKGDVERAFEEMRAAGAQVIDSKEIAPV